MWQNRKNCCSNENSNSFHLMKTEDKVRLVKLKMWINILWHLIILFYRLLTQRSVYSMTNNFNDDENLEK